MSIQSSFRQSTLPWLGLLALLASPCLLGAAELTNDSSTPVINTTCPMDGKMLDMTTCKMVNMTVGEGADAKKCRMACCSDTCASEFTKDPATVMKANYTGPKGGDTRKSK